jgi:ubiquinone/menaquinone biosynthesis C-methylase UbiE
VAILADIGRASLVTRIPEITYASVGEAATVMRKGAPCWGLRCFDGEQSVLQWELTGLLSNLDHYERIAPFYDLLDLPFEYGRYRNIPPLLFEGLAGRILDAGVGTGRNIRFYPVEAEVVGIDISPAMLARAKRRCLSFGADVELRQMDVTCLEFEDQSFDAVVATFLFCVLPDDLQVPALRELGRVVKRGGTIRLLEYVRPRGAIRKAITRLWEPWVAWAYGAGFDRRTEERVPEAGLKVVGSRLVADDLIRLITLRVPWNDRRHGARPSR